MNKFLRILIAFALISFLFSMLVRAQQEEEEQKDFVDTEPEEMLDEEGEGDGPCELCEPMLDRDAWAALQNEHAHHEDSGNVTDASGKRALGPAALRWNGGPIMKSVRIRALYWGTKWADPNFVKDKITGLAKLHSGFNNSRYAAIMNEYTGSNGRVTSNDIRYLGHKIDRTSASAVSAQGSTLFNAVKNAVCRNFPTPDPNGMAYYPVFVDIPKPASSNYCAWHSYGTCSGVRVQFAFFWNLDNNAGCSGRDSSGRHSFGLAALVNVAAHELNEARSDPMINAWKDASGYECSDKCAWRFLSPYVTLSNGAQFRLQSDWSNAQYAATGSGCVSRSN